MVLFQLVSSKNSISSSFFSEIQLSAKNPYIFSSRKRSADDRSDRDREKSRSSKAVKDEFDEVAELNRLNRVAAMNDKTTDDDLAATGSQDIFYF